MSQSFDSLKSRITACTICAERFARTATAHAPRPVFWLSSKARILIAGQAPGARVHESGVPFDDPSGDRLRDWLGVDRDAFYDRNKFAVLPMAFCFPGYNDRGADLPPPPVCAKTWHEDAMKVLPGVRLTLLVGGYAQRWHLGARAARTVTDTVKNWRSYGSEFMPLPHPSWRNTGWIKKNPWFESELLPVLKTRVAAILGESAAD